MVHDKILEVLEIKNNLSYYESMTTQEYFHNNQFSIDAFYKKYALSDSETYYQSVERVCGYIASAESTPELQKYWKKRWMLEILSDYWSPAGSIMQGASNSKRISMMNCFSKDTSFITDKGTKTFDNFNDGDTVNVLNNYGAFIESKIKKFGIQKLLKLTIRRNTNIKEIFCTSDHLWRVMKNTGIVEIKTNELNHGDTIPYIKRKWMPSENGSRYYCPIGFIHGYVFGDGCYNKDSDTTTASFCGDSKELVDKFKGFDWNIYNVANRDEIIIKYLPKWMKQLPNPDKENSEYLLGFIIGYFAADGTVNHTGKASIASANSENLLFVKNIGESLGLYSSDIKLVRNESPFDGNPEHKLYGLYFWKDCLFDSFFTKTKHKQGWATYKNELTNDNKLRLNWTVESIEETEREEEVWCVQVPHFENFTLSQGVNTHNCTTIGLPNDSLEAILKYTAYNVARTASYRQGLGTDYSNIRPRNSKINNSANFSDGVISWMSLIDSLSYYVGQKGRIPAQLMSLSCTHPDLEEFITVKSNHTKIQNANISVQCTNAFYKAVINNDDWELKFIIPEIKIGDKIYLNEDFDNIKLADDKDASGYFYYSKFHRKKEVISKIVRAQKILEMIAKGMFEYAEPGIQNIDIARKYSNSDYVGFPIISTNACSEQYLDDNGNCNLASINCSKFFHSTDDFCLSKLEVISESVARFLDNVIEMEIKDQRYATYKQKVSLESLRRIGAGVTNIVGLLFRKNLEYGSESGNDLIEKFIEKYNYFLYKTSIKLGKEKGNFKAFKKENYCNSPFVKRMMKKFPDLTFDTMRNVCSSSIAPVGTLSLMMSDLVLSMGIEPAFGLYFWKRTRISGKYKYYFCVPNDVRKFFEEKGYIIPINSDSIEDTWDGKFGKPIAEFIENAKKELNINFKDSLSVKPLDKLDLMAKVMKNIDSSISVTYLLPQDSNWKDVYNFILEAHKREIKSIAAFPDKKMYGIVSFIPFKDLAFKMKEENVEMHPQNFTEDELKELDLSVGDIPKPSSEAPKRPKELNSDIYNITVKGEKFVIAIGLLNGEPYEIFGGHMNGLNFKFQHKSGKIIKISRGKYKLEFDDFEVEDFSQQFTPVEKSLFRSLSTSLRHGVPVKYIVEQLQKAEDDMFSIQSAAARVLKKYIKEKEKVTGSECPSCHLSGTLIYSDGCVECSNCQYQKCS